MQPPLQPWLEKPSRLVSWLDMLQFSAERYVLLGYTLKRMESQPMPTTPEADEALSGLMRAVAKNLKEIGCDMSSHSATRLEGEILHLEGPTKVARLEEFKHMITDEMRKHLFFWVPPERAGWFSKMGQQILGEEGASRFPHAVKEVESAARCFAFGEWTACVLHMIRCADVGVNALSAAIQVTEKKPTWGTVYNELVRQMGIAPRQKPPYWDGRERILEKLADPFRSIKPYRDEAAHFPMNYDDKDAERMMASCPDFMRQLSTIIDESGAFV